MLLGILFQVEIVLYRGDFLNFDVLCVGIISFPEVCLLVFALGI